MKVALIMGSDSDFPVMKKAVAIFKEFGVDYEVLLASAHRTPAAVREFVMTAEERGIGAFAVGAGMAAHLPGVVASYTTSSAFLWKAAVCRAWMPSWPSFRCRRGFPLLLSPLTAQRMRPFWLFRSALSAMPN